MSYDPTERASQPPDQQPPYGQPPQQPPQQPPYGQPPQQPPQQPLYGQSNPSWPPAPQTPIAPTVYGQPPQQPPYNQPPTQQASPTPPPYGQSSPSWQSAPQTPPAPPPPYGQSSPSLPSYGQPPQAPAYGQSSSFPYDQPAGGVSYDPYAPTPAPGQPYQADQPWGAGVPPAFQPAAPPKKSNLKTILIVLIVILVLAAGGGGTALYFATRPQPVINVTSQYSVGSTPAGATSTTFTVTGHDFSGNSTITFLLDNAPIPGGQTAQSDSNGNVSTTFTVTDAWAVGPHTITAKDASGYTTKVGKAITIVKPGQANTPGPHGAPTDSATMTIQGTVNAGSSSGTLTLTVNGGKVCRDIDDGQSHDHTGTSNGVGYTETTVHTCSGSYQGGHLSYTETATTDKIVFDNGLTCTAHVPYVSAHLEGDFSSPTSISGNYTEDSIVVDCNMGVGSQTFAANTGTWSGVASVQ